MPRVLNYNGEQLPVRAPIVGIGPEAFDADGHDAAMQYTDDEWQAYQDEHDEYTDEERAAWEADRRQRRRAERRRRLIMPATPSADENLNGDSLLSLCINNKLLNKSSAVMPDFHGKKGTIFDEWLMDTISTLQAKGIPDLTKSWTLQKLHLPLDQPQGAVSFKINMPGHPRDGQPCASRRRWSGGKL